jgi:hypothetical protein
MRWIQLTFAVLFVCGMCVIGHAADEPTTKPSSPTTKPSNSIASAAASAGPKLFFPYSKMTSLTSEQQMQIHEIRRKTLAAKHDLDAKEADALAALLSDDQKTEARELEDKAAADRKTRASANKSAQAAAASEEKKPQ